MQKAVQTAASSVLVLFVDSQSRQGSLLALRCRSLARPLCQLRRPWTQYLGSAQEGNYTWQVRGVNPRTVDVLSGHACLPRFKKQHQNDAPSPLPSSHSRAQLPRAEGQSQSHAVTNFRRVAINAIVIWSNFAPSPVIGYDSSKLPRNPGSPTPGPGPLLGPLCEPSPGAPRSAALTCARSLASIPCLFSALPISEVCPLDVPKHACSSFRQAPARSSPEPQLFTHRPADFSASRLRLVPT